MGELDDAKAVLDDLTAEIIAFIDRTWAQISEAETRLVNEWVTLSHVEQTRRIRELQSLAAQLMTEVEQRARGDLNGLLVQAYEQGATQVASVIGFPGDVTATSSRLLASVSSDTYLDVLAATSLVRESTKTMVRALAQEAANLRLTGLTSTEEAGRQLAKAMAGKGITAIVYRDGSRHGLDEYAGMLMRTKTAEIYQTGGLDQAKDLGVTFVELLDNPSCGLSRHDDPRKANGLVLSIEEAAQYRLSHPNCVRATTPRVDIRTAAQARLASPSPSAAQNADQAVVEQARTARRALTARARRNSSGILITSTGAATSAAARRNAARVARRSGSTA